MTAAIVNLYQAKTSLPQLVERAAAGEAIIIAKAGKPKARLVPPPTARRRASPAAGKARSGSPTTSTSPCRPMPLVPDTIFPDTIFPDTIFPRCHWFLTPFSLTPFSRNLSAAPARPMLGVQE